MHRKLIACAGFVSLVALCVTRADARPATFDTGDSATSNVGRTQPTFPIFKPIPGTSITASFCQLKPRPVEAQCWQGWTTADRCYFNAETGYPQDGYSHDIDHNWGYMITPTVGRQLRWGEDVESVAVDHVKCITKDDSQGILITAHEGIGPDSPLLHVTGFANVTGDASVNVGTAYSAEDRDVVIAIQSQDDNSVWHDEKVGYGSTRDLHAVVRDAANRNVRLEVRTAGKFKYGSFRGANISYANLFIEQCYPDASNPGVCL